MTPAFDRLVRRLPIGDDDACWEWPGATNWDGYGRICDYRANGTPRMRPTHQVAYEGWVGPIPAGCEIDHLCRNKLCLNPRHLDAVTHAENMRRAGAVVTHCPAGHEYVPANTDRSTGRRSCRRCRADREAARRRRMKQVAP